MKVLHTSDWHLGRCLYARKRYDEFAAFLNWLITTIKSEKVDALLVAGDIFDTTTPSNRAQQLYYQFLCRVATTNCRHIVIIGGNHDSPTFLDAPKELLRVLNVHVLGSKTDSLDDEVIVLNNESQTKPQLIVCAVPYLRDRDIRTFDPADSIENKGLKLIEGLQSHYAQVCDIAANKQAAFKAAGLGDIPIVAMGHLFTAGGKTIDGDGTRELYVGSLAAVSGDSFPPIIDYLALGHLHAPQTVGGNAHMRYSGSPIPMSFGEANQIKKLVLAEFAGKSANIRELDVPRFQELVQISGTIDEIHVRLNNLIKGKSTAWLEIYCESVTAGVSLRDDLEKLVAGSGMELLLVRSKRAEAEVIAIAAENESLRDLSVYDVFNRCLDGITNPLPADERTNLIQMYSEIVQSVQENDANAE